MSTSETITRTDLTNILNEVLPIPPLNELIYSGSFATGTTTLQKSVANYVKILIVYEDNDGTTHTKLVITNKASAFTTVCTVLRVTGMDYKKGMIVSFNGTSMVVQNNKQGAGTATPTDGSYITIKKVYGVKAIDSDAIAEQADYIVEQGTDGSWKYHKWNSGFFEAWRVSDAGATGALTQLGSSGIYYGSAVEITFPSIGITSIHSCDVDVMPEENYIMSFFINRQTTSSVYLGYIRFGSGASVSNIHWRMHICGTYA